MRKVPSRGAHGCLLASLLNFLSISVGLSSEPQQQTVGCPQENPIIIIGAGLSGVSAAKALKDAGCPTIILEAKDRIGGRLLSQTFGTTMVDLGGASIHGQGSYLQAFMVEKNMTLLNWGSSIYPGMNEAEWIRYQPDGGSTKTLYAQEFELASESTKKWRHVMGECIDESSSNDQDENDNQDPFHACLKSSLAQLSTQTGLDMDILKFQIFMEYELDRGLGMDQVDAHGFMNDWDWVDLDAPDVGVVQGMQTVVELMAQGLNVQLYQRVAHIQYSKEGCTVTTQGEETYTSAACLVTLPLGVLKQRNTLALFDPPLPVWKQEAIDRGGLAIFNTLIVQWNRPICRTTASFMIASPLEGQNPLAHGFVCPAKIRNSKSNSSPMDMYDVTQFYIAGDRNAQGHPLDFEDMEFWKQEALQVIQLYAAPIKGLIVTMDDIVDAHLTAWHLDPDFGASYSAPVKGTRGNSDRLMLKLPLDNTVFFAGEHTNTYGRYQTIDGAEDSGYFAARAICDKFGVSKEPRYHPDSVPQKEEL
jgi:monoamine oxidase